MGMRRQARERAIQFLFQHDLNPPEDLQGDLSHFWQSQQQAALAEEKGPATWGEKTESAPPSVDEAAMQLFADELIRGALEKRTEVDELIQRHAKNWDMRRMAAVDRNILRLAVYEMLFRNDIPPVVSINEAVDIAKKFSTQDSGKFVNGILDKIRGEVMRPARSVKS
jgi:N utilization substance protein B